jgi:hypothetical protein
LDTGVLHLVHRVDDPLLVDRYCSAKYFARRLFISLSACGFIVLLAWFGDRYEKMKEGVTIAASPPLRKP